MDKQKDLKQTFKHAAIYSCANILAKLVGFVMLPVYSHYLHGKGYGIIGMIDVFISVLSVFIGYGVSSSMRVMFFQKKTLEDKNSFVSTALITMMVIVGLVVSPALLFNEAIGNWVLGFDNAGYMIVLAASAFAIDIAGRNAETYILILQRPLFFSSVSLARLVIGLSLNIYLIVYCTMGVYGYLYSTLVTAIIYSLVMHLYVIREVGISFNKGFAAEILRFALPLIPGYVFMALRDNADRVIIRKNLGFTQLGAYEMLFKFLSLLPLFITDPIMKIWGVKRFEIASKDDDLDLVAQVCSLHLFIMLFAGLVLTNEIPVFLKILTPNEFWVSGNLVIVGVVARTIADLKEHFAYGLYQAKATHKVSIVIFWTSIISIVSHLSCITLFGFAGALFGVCIVNIFSCALYHIYSLKYVRVPFEWYKMMLLVVLFAGCYIGINGVFLVVAPHIKTGETQISHLLTIYLNSHEMIFGIMATIINRISSNVGLILEGTIKLIASLIFPLIVIAFKIFPIRITKGFRIALDNTV